MVKINLRKMSLLDVLQVYNIEKNVFSLPWELTAFKYELTQNHMANYYVYTTSETNICNNTTNDTSNDNTTNDTNNDNICDDNIYINANYRNGSNEIYESNKSNKIYEINESNEINEIYESNDSKATEIVVAYIGYWQIFDEAHITTIAVKPEFQGKGIGTKLLTNVMQMAKANNIENITLEVRISNDTAIKMYKKLGFKEAGIRKKYYSDNDEDALIMWAVL